MFGEKVAYMYASGFQGLYMLVLFINHLCCHTYDLNVTRNLGSCTPTSGISFARTKEYSFAKGHENAHRNFSG